MCFQSFISQLCTQSCISVKVYFSYIRTTLDGLFWTRLQKVVQTWINTQLEIFFSGHFTKYELLTLGILSICRQNIVFYPERGEIRNVYLSMFFLQAIFWQNGRWDKPDRSPCSWFHFCKWVTPLVGCFACKTIVIGILPSFLVKSFHLVGSHFHIEIFVTVGSRIHARICSTPASHSTPKVNWWSYLPIF